MGRARPGDRVSQRDRLAAEALQELEDGLCPGCGQPRDEAWSADFDKGNPDRKGYYDPAEWRCHSCTALAAAHDARDHGKDIAGGRGLYSTTNPVLKAHPLARQERGGS